MFAGLVQSCFQAGSRERSVPWRATYIVGQTQLLQVSQPLELRSINDPDTDVLKVEMACKHSC